MIADLYSCRRQRPGAISSDDVELPGRLRCSSQAFVNKSLGRDKNFFFLLQERFSELQIDTVQSRFSALFVTLGTHSMAWHGMALNLSPMISSQMRHSLSDFGILMNFHV